MWSSDSNGFFHPIGDHAQTQFSIDNQPITDQQSKLYSNQISQDAVESMEIITGVAPAEYGDKSSLVVHIVTKSGLDQAKPTGTASVGYGSFNSPSGEFNMGAGSHTVGDFLSVSGLHTDRFLDPPEFEALHDTGHNLSFFNRLDFHPNDTDAIHLNIQAAQSGFDVPNTYDQSAQTQHQDINSFNIAPGYTRVIGSKTLFTANGFVRQDHLTYLPSANIFNDTPATVSQDRKLTNYGIKADVSYTTGNHNVKIGGNVSATKLQEHFTLGITDPTDPTWQDANGNFDPTFAPYDLTNGGSPFVYNESATIKQQAFFIQDDIKAGDFAVKLGLRVDHYDGLVSKSLAEPRLGVSYAVPGAGTVLRASYGRTMETPYNENLLLSSGLGLVGQFGIDGQQPLPPGIRDQGEFGIQQGFGRWLVADFGLFQQTYAERLRLQRPVQHTDRLSGRVGPLTDQRVHRPRQPRRAPRLQRVRRDGAHQRDLLAARCGRRPADATARRLPDRPRSEVQRDHQPPIRRRQGPWRVGGPELALRFRPRRRVGPGLRHGADVHRRPAECHRSVLRQHVCVTECADYQLFGVRTMARRDS